MNIKNLGPWLTYILLINALLAGCAKITVSEDQELAAEKFQPDPGYGNVYIVREKTIGGMDVEIDIDVNGRHIGFINIGTYHLLQLKPGRYTVSAYTKHGGDDEVVEVVEGENYFIQTEPVFGFFPKASAERIEANKGRKMVIDGSRLITKPFE